jgi:PqqD family protein of HPr-rel-A system
MAPGPDLWRGPPADRILLRDWETTLAVFDRRSGATHLLSALPAELLKRLVDSTADTGELAAAVAQGFDIAPDPAWKAKVQTSLEQLTDLQLVEHEGT